MSSQRLVLFSLLFFAFQTAHARAPQMSPAERSYMESYDVLARQVDKLARQNPRSCPQDHAPIFRGKSLRIAIYHGYEEYQGQTHDEMAARAFADILMEPCPPNLHVCGFRAVGAGDHSVLLNKNVFGQDVNVEVYWASVDPQASGLSQPARSASVRASFERDLVQSDLVFYLGHAHFGSGPGFAPQSTGEMVLDYITRLPLRPVMRAIETRPSRLKVLGLFACESDRYYREAVETRNPKLNLITAKKNIMNTVGAQAAIGSLNFLLGRKCEPEVQDSIVAESDAGSRDIRYIRRPF